MLIMERGACNLLQLLRGSTVRDLPWSARARLGAGVAAGVAFLHAQTPPILHRDLKSANVRAPRQTHRTRATQRHRRMTPPRRPHPRALRRW